jgi:hypothetical protein
VLNIRTLIKRLLGYIKTGTDHVAEGLESIIIIIIICFMQGIYTYIPETNYVPRKYSVAAIVLFLFMVHISLAPVLNLLHFYLVLLLFT